MNDEFWFSYSHRGDNGRQDLQLKLTGFGFEEGKDKEHPLYDVIVDSMKELAIKIWDLEKDD